jgi:hypothetical protein
MGLTHLNSVFNILDETLGIMSLVYIPIRQ